MNTTRTLWEVFVPGYLSRTEYRRTLRTFQVVTIKRADRVCPERVDRNFTYRRPLLSDASEDFSAVMSMTSCQPYEYRPRR